MHAHIQNWLNLAQLQFAPRTVQLYTTELTRLAAWAPTLTAQQFTQTDLARYLVQRRDQDRLSNESLNVALAAFRNFFRWLKTHVAEEIPFQDPTPDRVHRTLTPVEVERVVANCETTNPFGVRNLALFAFMYDCGPRATEICIIGTNQIDLEGRTFKVLGKRRQYRFGYFSEETTHCLRQWSAVRDRYAQPGVETFFVSLNGRTPGQPLTRRGLQSICQKAAERAGVPHFSPHAFRRGVATTALEHNCPNEVLQRFMGWRRPHMVSTYTRAMNQRAFEQFLPMAKIIPRTRP